MSVFDYILPHRFFINKSLRKEAEDLKAKINIHQAEFENKIQLCQIAIRNKEQEKNKEYEIVKKRLSSDLRNAKSVLDELGKNLMQYADEYLQRKNLYETIKLMQTEKSLQDEDFSFFSSQRTLIKEEIEILIERQKELSLNARVDDIIQLANNSGCEYGFCLEDDAEILLDKINKKIENIDKTDTLGLYSLTKLRTIVQERVEYLPLIKYIDWVIIQKKQSSKEITKKIKEIKENQRIIKLKIEDVRDEIAILDVSLINVAKKIRYYWAVPITLLNADITYDYKAKNDSIAEKQDKIKEIKDVQNELHSLAEMHSGDQNRWNQLKDRQSDLQSDINILKDEINEINNNIAQHKAERNEWFEKRNKICTSLKNNNIYLISDKKKRD